MKKYVQNFWVRFLAIILCSITLITGIISCIFIAGLAVFEENELYKDGREIIAENYAAYVYENVREGEHQNIEKIDAFLQKKNFTCSVTKKDSGVISEGTQEEQEIELYSNLADATDWDYEIQILDGSYVRYDIDSALDALRVQPVIESYVYTTNARIESFVFDANTGLFYYYADGLYFLADYIVVSENGPSYDYMLKTGEDGKKVYYNSYYNKTLDFATYEEWNWIQLAGTTLFFAEDEEDIKNYEIQIISDDRIEKNLYTGRYFDNAGDGSIDYYPDRVEDIYYVRLNVKDPIRSGIYYKDMFCEWEILWEAFFANESTYEVWLIISAILFVLSFALLAYSAKSKKEEIGFWNKVPVGIFTLCIGVIELGLVAGLMLFAEYALIGRSILPFKAAIILSTGFVFVVVVIPFVWLQNIITRVKAGTFIRYSEIYFGYRIFKWGWIKITSPLKTILKVTRENTSLFKKGIIVLGCVEFILFVAIVSVGALKTLSTLLALGILLIMIPVIVLILYQMQKLQEGSKRIATGDLTEPIDTSKMFWEFKKHGENINKVSDGIALAVEDRMKSERFKTELITNVSHDIKTPLTSIINYVDLIKKENIEDKTLLEYIEVLDRQSARLKKLIEDLMEASKASTGNMQVTMEACDVEVLLTQILGEFEERINTNQLEVLVQKPENPVIISADGRHMWRVLDNLLNNACKYSLPGSRIYVSLEEKEHDAVITFKNISKTPLNIPSEELMERFVRGDSSRNTEGSGLGLSIAQSLTELMKGSMKLEIDGDLFKVILRFQTSSK